MIDYKKLGLKVGLEFHQMLNTNHKLFCNCPTSLEKESPDIIFRRNLRVSYSELGEIDPAALFEFQRKKTYVYEYNAKSACLVEMDEEPPHNVNEEALKIALMIALLLNSKPVDEVHVMRKIVIDGSNTSGFQRTMLIALGGSISIGSKEIPVQTVCLEEDAARKVKVKDREIYYKLDRLGIPLIEIATAPVIKDPREAEEVAFKIGQLLRITGKIKRGLGTIRQDVNVSIKNGAKTEIKGVQKLELISKVVEYEALRQVNLLKISEELRKRGIKEEDLNYSFKDISHVFSNTHSRIIAGSIKKGKRVLAVKLHGFKGILGIYTQPNRRFGTELSDYAKAWGGVGGIIHSDELPGYGISVEEIKKIESELLINPSSDAFVMVVDYPLKAKAALRAVVDRAKFSLRGIPEETRGPNPDGTTHYSRPRPGSARMYPETDIRPVKITSKLLNEITKNLPERPEEKYMKFKKVYGLNEVLAKQMISSYYLDIFEEIVEEVKVPATIVATTLENIFKNLKREGYHIEDIPDNKIKEVFLYLKKGLISKEALSDIFAYLSKNLDKEVEEAIKELGFNKMTVEELKEIIKKVLDKEEKLIRNKKEGSLKVLMGEVMKEVRGKIDGKMVYETLSKELWKRLTKKSF